MGVVKKTTGVCFGVVAVSGGVAGWLMLSLVKRSQKLLTRISAAFEFLRRSANVFVLCHTLPLRGAVAGGGWW